MAIAINKIQKDQDSSANPFLNAEEARQRLDVLSGHRSKIGREIKDIDVQIEENGYVPREFVNAGHFDEPNILAHLRMKDRVDADGNKTLLIEEAQSDWHQKGADVGYKPKDGSVSKPLQDEMDRIEQEMGRVHEASRISDDLDVWMPLDKQFNDLNSELGRLKYKADKGVPDAPFKTDDKSSWYNLAMKRGLIEAAEGDYNKLAITTGRQQADRYDLSKQINEVRLGGNERDGFTVSAFDKNNTPVIMESIESLDELPNLIGKDAAKSLVKKAEAPKVSGSARVLAGQDLSVGGEGMKEFYDRKLPNTLNKLVKQDGVKVGQSELLGKTPSKTEIASASDREEILRLRDEIYNGDDTSATHDRYNQLLAMYQPKPRTDTVHSIDITPEMRERVKKGLPLFAQGGAVVGAGALFSPDKAQAGASAEQQKFESLEAEEQKLRAMRSSSFGKVSSELAAYRRSQLLPSIGTLAQGAVRDTAKGLDYLSGANLTRLLLDPADEGLSRFFAKPISDKISQGAKAVTQPMLFDEADPYSKKRKQDGMDLGGMLFSPL